MPPTCVPASPLGKEKLSFALCGRLSGTQRANVARARLCVPGGSYHSRETVIFLAPGMLSEPSDFTFRRRTSLRELLRTASEGSSSRPHHFSAVATFHKAPRFSPTYEPREAKPFPQPSAATKKDHLGGRCGGRNRQHRLDPLPTYPVPIIAMRMLSLPLCSVQLARSSPVRLNANAWTGPILANKAFSSLA
jgi:hypothetical protein